ncbi:EAL domain-containing protein [Dasania sp. GY-MA-18]|uniref:cyclic-guanylate-specific phosphodiesterase n=1 Tax=Dasania phycosphaerae TaxID=2950436 RepID=A0A9J6RJK1_9GAMM|nr:MULTISPECIES: EAL domain-containing protein [Dasania]MCR8922168.1 EAL domain-containing protein [Dasania sp. GY-MA-18]MCZ0864596.1 EAL domain-containing protein [Dasania phycosphaerae]MCZ0868324.1 EAL domain-containing protein [Dasania phycosphaerae]
MPLTIRSQAYMGLLEHIAVAANEANSTNDSLQKALEYICQATGWALGHVFVSHQDNILRSANIWHISAQSQHPSLERFREDSEARPFAKGEGIPGRVYASGQPEWIINAQQDDTYLRHDSIIKTNLKSCFAFPVLTGNKVVAILEFYSLQAQRPDHTLLDVMKHIGVQLGRVFEREQSQQQLANRERRHRQILNSTADAFIAMNSQGEITAWNLAAQSIFGWRSEQALGRTVSELIVPQAFRQAHHDGMQRFLKSGKASILGQTLELPAMHNAGHEFPIEITLWSLQEKGEWSFFAFARDITERKRSQDELKHKALHDALTGLPNRILLLDRLSQHLEQRENRRSGLATLFVDLDHFKRINDSFGHEAGDRALIEVANRLRHAVRPVDTVARLAGDEFVIACPDIKSPRDAAIIAQRILDALAPPMQLQGDSIFLNASVGIALADTNSSAENLISAADIAMYEAKSSGRGEYQLFDERMQVQVTARLRVENDMRHALEHDKEQFCLHFQPIIESQSGDIVCLEALVRWQHPERGLLSPIEFIPMAEETGLIVPLGEWILELACQEAKRWEQLCQIQRPLDISVNLSGRQLAQADLVTTISNTLSHANIDPSRFRLGFEVTETEVMRDPATAATTLQTLRDLGAHLSIDDFGTGYSSLAYLKQFPVDTIKIDRSFITHIMDSPADQAIVSSVVYLAHALNHTVVAEGVETIAQADKLREMKVDYIQGYLFAKPQPAEQLLILINQQQGRLYQTAPN